MASNSMRKTLNTLDVWFAPLAEICAHVKAAHQDNDQPVRVEHIPYYDEPQASSHRGSHSMGLLYKIDPDSFDLRELTSGRT